MMDSTKESIKWQSIYITKLLKKTRQINVVQLTGNIITVFSIQQHICTARYMLLWQVPLSGASNKSGVAKTNYILNVYVNISKTVKDTSKVTINDW